MTGVPKKQALERLERLLAQGESVAQAAVQIDRPADHQTFKLWQNSVIKTIKDIFGDDSRQVQDFSAIDYYFPNRSTSSKIDFQEGYTTARWILEALMDDVRVYRDEDIAPARSTIAVQNEAAQVQPATRQAKPSTGDVFIVHGHDDGLKEAVARFLSRLGLNPVILHEQADQGRTVIEKFQAHSDVSFAISLFTPDDVGGIAGKTQSPRARQNVVFELGYFVGRLGRTNAVALVKGDVELPSDWSGVLYIRVDDAGQWRFQLVRELKAAGFDVDANRVL